jgi:hypothetical protein
MMRLNGGLLPVALIATATIACGGSSGTSNRAIKGSFKQNSARMAFNTKTQQLVKAPPAMLLNTQIQNRPKVRAKQSLPITRALATKFTPLNSKLIPPRPAVVSGTAASGPHADAFDPNVAAFAYDNASGAFYDAVFLDPASGSFDLNCPEADDCAVWVGTYDMAANTGNVVEPISYGFDYDLPPATVDVSYTYDEYFDVSETASAGFDSGYVAATTDQSGYYELAYSGGTSYLYLLADDAAVGSYYMIWDDGTCAQGTQTYVAFDSTGNYFTANGVSAAFSLSGVSTTAGTFAGSGVRFDVVADDGQNYQTEATVTFLNATSTGPSCPTGALVDPCAAGACSLTCPPGCSLDIDFGICTIDGTLDAATGIGESCETADLSQSLIICPTGCAEPVPADGFCYLGGSTANAICY